jgi:hypothetical protein
VEYFDRKRRPRRRTGKHVDTDIFAVPHAVGQRVERERDIYRPQLGMRTGIITRRYEHRSRDGRWHYPEMYAVQWDGDAEEDGFLRHGLTPI